MLQRTDRYMVTTMCGVQLNDRKRAKDLMLMLALNEAIYQVAMANSVNWYGHVLRMEDDHVIGINWSLSFKVKGRMGGRKGHKRSWLKKKA